MGWISVGLLILSGGCILYRHPPTSAIQLLSRYVISRRDDCAKQLQHAEETPLESRLNQGQTCSESSPSISVTSVQGEDDDSPARNPIPSAKLSAPSPLPADSTGIVPPPILNAPNKGSPSLKTPTFSSMPPPPRPSTNTSLRPPPSAASSLRVPPTKTLSTAAFAPSRLTAKPAQASRQVTLTPGHSPLDWAALASDPNNKLRGKDAPSDKLIRVPPSRLRYQNGRKGRDAWTMYQGKVYNITPYLPFHPGGEAELMRGAGRDAAKLFMEVHPWVNWEAMLGECVVGILVAEGEEEQQQQGRNEGAGELDEMD